MISIIVPAYNEAQSLQPLTKEIMTVMKHINDEYEIILVNDGSTDRSQVVIDQLGQQFPRYVRGLTFRRNFGKAAALAAGFDSAKGEIIITLDGDLQDDPREIPRFIEKIKSGYDLVSGWKQHRQDPLIKNISSRLFNFVTGKIFEAKLHDFNCGFKAYRAETVKELALYGELHRFIPVLLAARGYKIGEIPVNHRRRQFGKSKYGSIRFINGFFDLLTVLFITKFHLRPLHMIGPIGMIFFLSGFIEAAYLTYDKIVLGQPIGNRPLLLLAVMSMIMGVQIGITGLVGEQITASLESQKKHDHQQLAKTHQS